MWVKSNVNLLSSNKLDRQYQLVYPKKHEGDFARDFIELIRTRLGVQGSLSTSKAARQSRGMLKILIHEFKAWIFKEEFGYCSHRGGHTKHDSTGQRSALHIGSIRDVLFPVGDRTFRVSFIGTEMGGHSHVPALRSIKNLFSRRKHGHVSTRDASILRFCSRDL